MPDKKSTYLINLIREQYENCLSKQSHSKSRRDFFVQSLVTVIGAGAALPLLTSCGNVLLPEKVGQAFRQKRSNIPNLGELNPADQNGVRLPQGFSSRIVAKSNYRPLDQSDFLWHWAPDGGAVFDVAGGGWIYVSNSEMSGKAGGASALVFGVNGDLRDAYSILKNTSRNCGGGMTPWATWLSCEEVSDGLVWECDPLNLQKPKALKALGTFTHEAVAFDTVYNHLYLTEDEKDGRLYRFRPDGKDELGRLDLTRGVLEVAEVENEKGGKVTWHSIFDPNAKFDPTRYQVRQSTAFENGEGIAYQGGKIFFTTKGDNRIWQLNTKSQQLQILYDDDTHPNPILKGVDNITVMPTGDIFVAEDGDDMQLIAITPDFKLIPVLQVERQPNSEITGPAFNKHGDKLYFSSQRGFTGTSAGGITYEVTGPFYI